MITFALLGGLCCILAIVFCALRLRAYRSWFGLPIHRTDMLQCRPDHAELPVRLNGHGIQMPPREMLNGRTVLLQVQVRSLLFGHLWDPFIEVTRDGVRCRQYFERGARGRRYLDLSPLFRLMSVDASSDPWVHLRGVRVRWAREGILRVFEPPNLTDATVLIVAPHPDDAEIAAFGVYATHRSWVVTLTAGERGGGVPISGLSAQESLRWSAMLRVADSLSVPQLGKVSPERCLNLAYADGALESMHRRPTESFAPACEPLLPRSELRSLNGHPQFRHSGECAWNTLIDELSQVLQLSTPDVVICPHPGLDTNSDHVFTTRAVESAVRQTGGPVPLFLLYSVHHAGAPTYPYGPATALSGLPANRGQPWICDSIYSHQLDPELRLAKHFALESMHAIRCSRMPLKAKVLGLLSGLGKDPTDFLRRGPRPTEMYYVVSGEQLASLVRAQSTG